MHNNASPRNITLLPGTAGIIAAGYQPIPGRDTNLCHTAEGASGAPGRIRLP